MRGLLVLFLLFSGIIAGPVLGASLAPAIVTSSAALMPSTGKSTRSSAPSRITLESSKMAEPPIQVWIPNQPHATSARNMDGMFAPSTPNDGLRSTGNGMP